MEITPVIGVKTGRGVFEILARLLIGPISVLTPRKLYLSGSVNRTDGKRDTSLKIKVSICYFRPEAWCLAFLAVV